MSYFLQKIVSVIIYSLVFQYAWVKYCNSYFEYFGFSYHSITLNENIVLLVILVIPFLFYRGLLKISSFLSLFIYLFGYIPIVISLSISNFKSSFDPLNYQLTFMICMILLFVCDKLPEYNLVVFKWHKKFSYHTFIAIAFFLTLYLIIVFRGKISLTSFADVYNVRFANNELIHSGINGYIIGWLDKCFFPLILISSFYTKNIKFFLFSVFGILVLYGIQAQKSFIVTPLFVLFTYFVYRFAEKHKIDMASLYFMLLSIMTVLPFINIENPIAFSIEGLIFLRTEAIAGLLGNLFIDFFQDNPFTYFSHVGIINKITHEYPYSDPLGVVVSINDSNANAIFWLTDGIASCDIMGVFIITVLLVVYFQFINSLHLIVKDKLILFLIFQFSVTALLNGSFFTYLISHGVIVMILSILIFKIPAINSK